MPPISCQCVQPMPALTQLDLCQSADKQGIMSHILHPIFGVAYVLCYQAAEFETPTHSLSLYVSVRGSRKQVKQDSVQPQQRQTHSVSPLH